MKMTRLIQILAFIGIGIIASPCAFGSYLTINGSSALVAKVEGTQVKISGSYQIENKGDETAQNVFPAFKVGRWSWAGEPKSIVANGKESWEINSNFAKADLFKQELAAVSDNFSERGQFPLLVHRHYEDSNGVHFSAADVAALTIGDLKSDELSTVRIPTLNGSLNCQGDGNSFTCLLDYRNLDSWNKKVFIEYHTSQDLQIKPVSELSEIDANGQKLHQSQVNNFSGLPGSSYAVFAILLWNDNGLNKFKSFSNAVLISNKTSSSSMIGAGIGAVIAVALVLYVFMSLLKKKRVGN